ncbi:UDP-glucose 4-epimerase GalE [Cumulibacter soli]|uniref:UDP-glucose 4-epimerase GalE n=1 Tax=Cumulibacter soli TaxID=2546344 RepID=UPI001FBA38EF|nr:UDP-glucose 4-epimerase GalE [Cumulibacter soli]
MKVLVTGGAGFIGSHTCVELLDAGHDVLVVDDLSAGFADALDRVGVLTGVRPELEVLDITDTAALCGLFARHAIDAVIHFAARKAVGESIEIPLEYFHTNVTGTISLLRAMREAKVRQLVFSSSCSIYGDTNGTLLDEQSPSAPANPYAWTKLTCEQLIAQECAYGEGMRAINLRYFNPIGAHPSGVLGEQPRGVPRNVLPYLAEVATGEREYLQIFGGDYPTDDGTAIRDYVHVVDVAAGHVAALNHLEDADEPQLFNLGTGVGTSVLELHAQYEREVGRELPYRITERRRGDVPRLVADCSRVQDAWGWHTQYDLAQMCADSWRFMQRNPEGYSR